MKMKNVLCKLIIYLFILNLMPMGFLSQSVKADEANSLYQYYNRDNTVIKNKYNIEGKIINVKQFEDYTVVLTKKGLYSIKDGKSSKFELNDVSYVSHIKMKDNEVYLTPYLDNYSFPQIYCMLRVNVDNNFSKKEKLHGDDITFDYYNKLVEAYADFEGKSWFSVFDFYNDQYRLLRLDQNGNSKEMDELNYKDYVHYDDAYTDMKVDKNNNLWFKITENNYGNNSVLYRLGRITESGNSSFIKFDDGILNYCICENGDIWVIEGDSKVIHLDEKGNKIKTFEMKGVKDITLDEDDNVWIIQNNTIKMLKNNSFEVKYTISEDMNQLSVLNDKKMVAAGIKGICLIDGDKVENIPVYSNINDRAYVISDGKGNIRVLSSQEEFGEWYIDNKFIDKDLTITEIDRQGKLKSESLKGERYISYELSQAKVYKNSIYIPSDDTIYKISRAKKEEYIKLTKDGDFYEYLNGIEIDNKGDIYAFGGNNLYKISNGKLVGKIGSKEILKNIENDNYAYYNKLLKDKHGNIYVSVNFEKNQAVYQVVYKINNLNKPQLMDELISSSIVSKEHLVNIFINENGELEAVYKHENGYSVYNFDNGKLYIDLRFIGDDEYVTNKFLNITKMVKASDGRIFILSDNNLLVIDKDNNKVRDGNYIVNYSNINSMEVDKDGRIYIGTYYEGLLRFEN